MVSRTVIWKYSSLTIKIKQYKKQLQKLHKQSYLERVRDPNVSLIVIAFKVDVSMSMEFLISNVSFDFNIVIILMG